MKLFSTVLAFVIFASVLASKLPTIHRQLLSKSFATLSALSIAFQSSPSYAYSDANIGSSAMGAFEAAGKVAAENKYSN